METSQKQCNAASVRRLPTYRVGTRLRNGLQMMNVTAPLRQSTDWHGQPKSFTNLFLRPATKNVCVLTVIDLHYAE